MKAILEFNLPEDQEDFNHANQAVNYYCAIIDIMQYLRSKTKYTEEVGSFEEVRAMCIEICNDRGVEW